MILANDFLEYLLNTERDLAARVRDRYDMYLKSLPVPQLADGKIVIDGRYMIDSHEGNYRLYRIEGGTPSVIGILPAPILCNRRCDCRQHPHHTSPCRHRRHRAGNSAAGYSLPRHPEWHDEVNHYDGRVHQGLATTAPRSGA